MGGRRTERGSASRPLPNGTDWEVLVMDSAGRHRTYPYGEARNRCWPSWSPYGDATAHVRAVGGNWDIYSMDDRGGHVKRLT